MKISISIILLILSFSSFAYSVDRAFKDFFNDSVISSRHCGKNIYHFLNYLDDRGIKYKEGYVVSLHDQVGALNHFDARWGSRESYQEGGNYYRSNWYFHVFAIIDGKAYDFSQRDSKTSSIKTYLEQAYLPAGTTESIIFLGRLNKDKALKHYMKMSMKIYDLKDYANNYGPVLYEGSFVELFNYLDNRPSLSYGPRFSQVKVNFDSQRMTEYGTTFRNPKVQKDGVLYPVKAEPFQICRSLGFMGAVNSLLEYEVSDQVKMLSLGSYFSKDTSRFISSKDIKVSSSFTETVGDIPNQPLVHFATSVTCSDFNSFGF